MCRFNTQPPEGGWLSVEQGVDRYVGFNTQPPEGGWGSRQDKALAYYQFQHTAA